ncbi:ABC transporter substrate-binding protein [Desulfolutivibrio sp.]|uniref:ABC transporter substrate-binding protein n=1 Tax=Desulfolutivibrio sp. TaxID=2773296 RepID=UPI002F96DA1E
MDASPTGLPPPRIGPRHGALRRASGAIFPLWRHVAAFFLLLWATPLAFPVPGLADITLPIGFVIGLTGPGAPDDSDIWDGALLAVEEINAAAPGGLHIVMTAHDTRGTPIMAKSATKQAIAAGAAILLAPSYSSQALEAAKVAQGAGIPIISVIATHPGITAVGDKVFRICFDDNDQADVMATFARRDLAAATAVILTDVTSAYALAMADAFRKRFLDLGGRVMAEIEYKMQQRHFDEVVKQAARAKADVLFMPGYWLDASIMIKQMHGEGLGAIPLAGDGWGSSQFENLRGELPRRGYYTDHWAAFMTDEISRRFSTAYAARFGRQPVAGSALAYDAVHMAALAAMTVGHAQPQALALALANMRDVQGVTGVLTFVPEGTIKKSVHIMKIQNGKASLLRTVIPEASPHVPHAQE